MKVIHIKSAPKGFQDNPLYKYIGRRNNRYGVQRSIFANPFIEGKDGSRDEVIEKFRIYITDRLAKEPQLRAQLEVLRGKTLICWCRPKACHADILLELLEAM